MMLCFLQISCVEHLCDTLCYHLDLAAFVACVNSGRSWSSKFSLLQSGKGHLVCSRVDTDSDLFVENFVLERLSVQSPLRVSVSPMTLEISIPKFTIVVRLKINFISFDCISKGMIFSSWCICYLQY